MDTVESSKRVLHRGRVQDDRLEEEAQSGDAIPEHSASADERQQMIAVAAYFFSQGRNFEPGQELEDWLAAEAQIDKMLSVEA
jgi:Protein of unknown function (DUF2934)